VARTRGGALVHSLVTRDDTGVKTAKSGSLDLGRLRALSTFAGCTDEEIDQVGRRLVMVEAEAGEVLVAEGDPGDYAYIIVSGDATVTQSGTRLASMGPGDLFGEMAMVAGGIRTATVRAATAVELLRLDAPRPRGDHGHPDDRLEPPALAPVAHPRRRTCTRARGRRRRRCDEDGPAR
jgi:hypothetical protein